MSLYPFNTNWGPRQAQTDAPGVRTQLGAVVVYSPGSLAAADADAYVTSTNMKNGAYTLVQNAPPVGARNVTVTHTAVGAADTLGMITVAGRDLAGNTISEDITPSAGATAQGVKAFASITSITGSGWTINEGNDTITVGYGDVIGLPDVLTDTAQVLAASLNNVRESTHPTVTVGTALSANTVDLNSALNGTAVKIYYML